MFFFLVALDHVGKFQELCCSMQLLSLKKLHFSLCFPKELEHAWRISSFGCNGEWPFNNLNCYIDQSWTFTDRGLNRIAETFFIVYRCPISVLLQHKRTVHNHHFASHASVPIRTTRQRSIEWTCDQIDEPDQLVNTLRTIASSHIDKLVLTYLVEQVKI